MLSSVTVRRRVPLLRRAASALLAASLVAVLTACVGSAEPAPTVTVTVTATPQAHPDAAPTSSAGEYGRAAVCALGDAGISLIVAGGSAAQALAALVVENVDDSRIRTLAERVRDGSDTAEIRGELGSLLGEYCDD